MSWYTGIKVLLTHQHTPMFMRTVHDQRFVAALLGFLAGSVIVGGALAFKLRVVSQPAQDSRYAWPAQNEQVAGDFFMRSGAQEFPLRCMWE